MPTAAELALVEVYRRELSRRSLVEYARQCFPRFELGAWQIDLLTRLQRFYDAVVSGLSPNLMIFAPPQNGKSMMVSRIFQAWVLGKQPTWPLILASYASSLAEGHGRWVRDRLESEEHQRIFPAPECRVRNDSRSVSEFRLMGTTMGSGQMLCRGVGSATTGSPAKIFTIDDPFKDREEAESIVIREKVKDWYHAVASTRLAPGGGRLIMHTRWHVDDLAGHILEEEKTKPGVGHWDVACYPAIAEEDDILGRAVGMPLHPERYSLTELLRKRAEMPDRDWWSIMQQRPIVAPGGFFEVGKINRLKQLGTPQLTHVYVGVDLALTPENRDRGDYSVFVAGGRDWLNRQWIVDVKRGRWDPVECAKHLVNFCVRHSARMAWIENGPSFLGVRPSIVAHMQQSGDYIPFQQVSHQGKSKDVRAIPMQGAINAGMLYIPFDAPWASDFLHELTCFPSGTHDDQVDAAAYLFQKMHALPHDAAPTPKESAFPSQRASDAARDAIRKKIAEEKANRTAQPSNWR
jgi:predicted phage terminase large subunit-like protein